MKSVLIDVDVLREKLGYFYAGDWVRCIAEGMTGTMHVGDEFQIWHIHEDGTIKMFDNFGDSRYTTLGDLLLNFDKIW